MSMAENLVWQGMPAVVTMQHSISDNVELCFCREFYRAVAAGRAVDAAVADGRRSIYIEYGRNIPDWGAPAIYLGALDGNIL